MTRRRNRPSAWGMRGGCPNRTPGSICLLYTSDVYKRQMLALSDDGLRQKLDDLKQSMKDGVAKKDAALQEKLREQ